MGSWGLDKDECASCMRFIIEFSRTAFSFAACTTHLIIILKIFLYKNSIKNYLNLSIYKFSLS